MKTPLPCEATHTTNTAKVTDSKGNETAYTYDAKNQLVKVAQTTANGSEKILQENVYNGDGQRIQKTEGTQETNYFYQNGAVVKTTNKEGNQSALYLYGNSSNAIALEDGTGEELTSYTYTKDVQGSIMELVGADEKSVTGYQYDAYGNTTISGKQTTANELAYTGGVYDKTTEEYYLNVRYYDPKDGRFLTQDTYRGEETDTSTWNLYSYCGGNPVNYVDPSGHKLQLLGGKQTKKKILSHLQKLTENKLEIKALGKVCMRINRKVKGKRFKTGTMLLYGIISSNKICTIRICYRDKDGKSVENHCLYSKNAENGVPSNADIYFNPKFSPLIFTYNAKKKRGEYCRRPTYIGLGHELIHAYRSMTGRMAKNRVGYYYINGKGKKEMDIQRIEELETVGILDSSISFTENRLRKEHNLPIRIKY